MTNGMRNAEDHKHKSNLRGGSPPDSPSCLKMDDVFRKATSCLFWFVSTGVGLLTSVFWIRCTSLKS